MEVLVELISFHTVSEYMDCLSRNRIDEIYASLIFKNASIDNFTHHFISSSFTFFKNNKKYRLLLENDCGKLEDTEDSKKKLQIESTRYSVQFRAICNVLGKKGIKIIKARIDEEVTAIQDLQIIEEEMQLIYKDFEKKLKSMEVKDNNQEKDKTEYTEKE
jgi:hypothetical protein